MASPLRAFDVNQIQPDSARTRPAALQSWPLPRPLRGSLRRLSVCLILIAGLTAPPVTAADLLPLPLAQVAPVKIRANARKVGRMYVVESVVVLVLFGGALYAVCRNSRRT